MTRKCKASQKVYYLCYCDNYLWFIIYCDHLFAKLSSKDLNDVKSNLRDITIVLKFFEKFFVLSSIVDFLSLNIFNNYQTLSKIETVKANLSLLAISMGRILPPQTSSFVITLESKIICASNFVTFHVRALRGYFRNLFWTVVTFRMFPLGAFVCTFNVVLPYFCEHGEHGFGWCRTLAISKICFWFWDRLYFGYPKKGVPLIGIPSSKLT